MQASSNALVLGLALSATLAAQGLRGPLLTNDAWPRATTIEEWTADVMRIEGVEQASETEQAKALFQWARLFNRMATGGMIQAYEGKHGAEDFVLDLHKTLFVYGWGYCDTTSRIAEAAWARYKGDPGSAQRVITQHEDGGYHTMYRLRLDGHWGAFDPRYGYYLIDHDAPDARILDWAEVGVDANIHKNKTYRNRSRPFFEYFGREWDRALLINECFYESQDAWEAAGRPVECVFADPKHQPEARFHDMDFRLLPGMMIERFWDNSADKFYRPLSKRAQREEAFLPSGRFYRVTDAMLDGNWPSYDPNYEKAEPYLEHVPEDEGYNQDVRGGRTLGQAWGRIVYEPRPEALGSPIVLQSPYIFVDGRVRGMLGAGATLEIRTLEAKALSPSQPDRWSEWTTLAEGPGPFEAAIGETLPNRGVHGVYRFELRAAGGEGVRSLRVEADFETGIMSVPRLVEGENTVRMRLQESARPQGPIRVRYDYTANGQDASQEIVFAPAAFADGEAAETATIPGLERCNRVSIEYR